MQDSGERLRVLVVSPSFPDQPSWGFARRVHHLAHGLAARHEVTVLAYRPADEIGGALSERQLGEVRLIAVPSPEGGRVEKRVNQARSIGSSVPFHAGKLRSSAMQRVFDAQASRADVVLLESSQMGWLKTAADMPVVVDEHNIESELLGRMAQSEASRLRRAYNRWEHVRYQTFERGVWGQADACTATSDRDAQAIVKQRPGLAVTVVPNGVDPEEFRPSGEPVEPDTIVFTGLLTYRPNVDGITWFLDEVLPLIQRVRPRVGVTVVGDGPEDLLESLRRPGVTPTGWVTDVRLPMQRAAVAIVPLRVGGGTRLKVVEAMSMAKAIVSTSLGSEGLDVESGVHLELADDAPGFAEAVVALLDDAVRAEALGRAARIRAQEQYSWTRAAATLETVLAQVVQRRALSGGAPGDA